MKNKPIIAIDFALDGSGGGPYNSSKRIINSDLKFKYDFKQLIYRNEYGRFISPRRIKDLMNQLKNIKPDIVHFTGLQLSGFHIAIACKLIGIQNTIMTVRGMTWDMIYFNPFKKIIVSFILEPISIMSVQKVYGVSEYVISRKVFKFFNKKIVGYIYNYPPKARRAKAKGNIRLELGLDKKDIIIATVARINREKGYHVYSKAISFFGSFKKVKFLIVGEGSYLEQMKLDLIEQQYLNQVFFLGHRDDIANILNFSDIFVLPTLHETLSGALLEASVAGLPLIASRTGGIPEIILDQYNGMLVTPGNSSEIVNALKNMIDNKSMREEMGKNAKKRVQEKFSSRSIDSKLDNLYKHILG